ncbi:hypothetical protein MA16_Dca014729 [Dendrobium catenatum]|uniref:Uncharacterized protein n=1 Tax=Dendrobium catenatum TaxID=906689 RepID=A0A2I0VIQ4_9ASPA|nr:hypothetical protein MA16_Dca014729 [Dendrobium catenatum]
MEWTDFLSNCFFLRSFLSCLLYSESKFDQVEEKGDEEDDQKARESNIAAQKHFHQSLHAIKF